MKLETRADVISTVFLMDRPVHADAGDLSLDEAYKVQDLLAERLHAPFGGLAGYKIAWNGPGALEAWGIPRPGVARVFSRFVSIGRAARVLADYRAPMLEVEIAAQMSKPLQAGHWYERDAVADAIGGYTAAFEILDRLDASTEPNAAMAIAHNIFNAGVVLAPHWIAPDAMDWQTLDTHFQVNGNMEAEGRGLAPQDPVDAVMAVANALSERGYGLRAGQIVLCGTHIPIRPVTERGAYACSIGQLGECWLTME